jgi:hypothetical protein
MQLNYIPQLTSLAYNNECKRMVKMTQVLDLILKVIFITSKDTNI